ncbi:hypothetical protein [Bradyrhizobium sp. Leo121]|uniref:hypothetical protein n=1 Tax=Bradyrhizobium sp. Leo121 TaxID=1571195 RepID=UPI00102882F0|nr:hypothetical protein [Bradyrhizobium sp. Leo121]
MDGGPDSSLTHGPRKLFRSLLPRAEEIGLVARGEIDIDRLEDHLRQAVTAVHAQIGFAHQHCGWARVL